MQFAQGAPSVKSMAFLNACNLSLNKWLVQKRNQKTFILEKIYQLLFKEEFHRFWTWKKIHDKYHQNGFQSPSSPGFLPDAGEQVNQLSHQRCNFFQTLTFQLDFSVLMLTKARFVLVSVLKDNHFGKPDCLNLSASWPGMTQGCAPTKTPSNPHC